MLNYLIIKLEILIISSRLPSMGSHRVGHDWSNLAAAAAAAAAVSLAGDWLN